MTSISDKGLSKSQAQAPSLSISQMTDESLVSNENADPLSSIKSLEEERFVSPIITPKGRIKILPPLPIIDIGQDVSTSDSALPVKTPTEILSSPLENPFQLDENTPESSIADSMTTREGAETSWSNYLSFSRSESEIELKRYSPEDLKFQSSIFSNSSTDLLLQQQHLQEKERKDDRFEQDSPQTSNSFASSATDHSRRLSTTSTTASSIPQHVKNENEVMPSDEYGIALGSPGGDDIAAVACSNIVTDEDTDEGASLNHVKVYNVAQVGLGLRSVETISMKGEIDSVTPSIPVLPLPQPSEISTRPTIPPRATSRSTPENRSQSRASSSSSSKQSGGSPVRYRRITKKDSFHSSFSKDVSIDESIEGATRTPPPLSIYTESIRSYRRDSMASLSPISPRTSSIKKAKSRNRLKSKDSMTLVKMQPQSPRLNDNVESTSSRHGHQDSISSNSTSDDLECRHEGSLDKTLPTLPLTASKVSETREAKESAMMQATNESIPGLMDYLAYTAAGLTNDEPTELSKSIDSPVEEEISFTSERQFATEESQGVEAIVKASGKRLTEIQSRVGPGTTQLLLSGSQDEKIIDFLEGVLPLIGKSLLILDVSNTRLDEIPECLSYCSNLRELNISSNSLKPSSYKDSSWATKFTNLQTFTADHCCLSLVPIGVKKLKNLTKLSIQYNKLTHLPSWLHRLDQLDTLLLAGNPFKGQWEMVCRGLIISIEMPLISKQETLDNVAASNDGHFQSQPTSPVLKSDREKKLNPALQQEKAKPVRPSIRKMKSHGSEVNFFANDISLTSALYGEESSAQRPPLLNISTIAIGENGEKKWGNMIRKMARKSSSTNLSTSYVAGANSDEVNRNRSNSFKDSLRRRPKIEVPAIPLAFQSSINLSSPTSTTTKAKPDFVRNRFIAQHANEMNGDQKNHLRGLMQYLQDLDDLGCDQPATPLATPGSELSMNLSMASQTSSSSSSSQSKGMSRSESENSRKSSASDTSISSNECPSLTPSHKDDASKRIHIIQELLATEESYIRTLQELVKIYVTPSAILDPMTGHCLISLAERKRVFSNVDGILQFHQSALYPALRMVAEPLFEEREENNEEDLNVLSAKIGEKVAGVMLKHAAFFRMYTAYVNGVNDAVGRVAIWRSSQRTNAELDQGDMPPLNSRDRKRIKAFLIKARSDKRHSQLSLETYLHLPVQRIPRYRLLLEDLVRNCPKSRLSDPTILTRALESICSIATLMNESKRQNEKNRKLLEWQNRVKENFPSPLVQPHRQLLKDGTLMLQRIVTRSSAFHISSEDPFGEQVKETANSPQVEIDESKNGMIQVHCLDQQSINKKVTLLLCNDITVLLTNDSPHSGPTSPVNLFAVIRIKESVQLQNQKTLRIVDAKHILYFTASTPAEAQEWQEALSKVHQQA